MGTPMRMRPKFLQQIGAKEITDKLRPMVGVYIIAERDGEVLYVGQSVNVLVRVPQHEWYNLGRSVYFIPCYHSNLNSVEGALIRKLKPKHNGRHSSGEYFTNTPARDHDDINIIQRLLEGTRG